MSLKPSEIRQRVSAAVVAALPAWKASRYAYPMFPGNDAGLIEPRSFSVGVTSSAVVDQDGRQIPTRGALTETVASVRFTLRVRADASVADFDAALDAEVALVAAVLALDRDPEMDMRYRDTAARAITGDGTVYLGEIRFTVRHMYPLA